MLTHTTVIILITLAVSFTAWQSPAILQRLIFRPVDIKQGQIDRFITHGFIHGDGWHLFFNMFTLYFFGRIIEKLYVAKFGFLGFLGFYVLAIIVSALPNYIMHHKNPQYASLGASGGVSAVLFAFVLIAPWNLIYFFGILPIPAIGFAILYVGYSVYAAKRGGGRIDHVAHLAGAGFGVVATVITQPSIVPHFINALLHPKF